MAQANREKLERLVQEYAKREPEALSRALLYFAMGDQEKVDQIMALYEEGLNQVRKEQLLRIQLQLRSTYHDQDEMMNEKCDFLNKDQLAVELVNALQSDNDKVLAAQRPNASLYSDRLAEDCKNESYTQYMKEEMKEQKNAEEVRQKSQKMAEDLEAAKKRVLQLTAQVQKLNEELAGAMKSKASNSAAQVQKLKDELAVANKTIEKLTKGNARWKEMCGESREMVHRAKSRRERAQKIVKTAKCNGCYNALKASGCFVEEIEPHEDDPEYKPPEKMRRTNDPAK